MTNASAAFRAHGIRKIYGKLTVLDDLSIEIPTGMALGLLGENGAGKTTLLKILLGLARADTGEALVVGEDARSLSPRVRARIGYVPQTPAQFPWLTGKKMLDYIGGFYPAFDREYASSLADRWKISLRTPIEALSPGQQQRLSIVRALSSRPDILVLDEPIASIDPPTRLAVIEELLAARRERTLTLIFSSHIVGDLKRLCTHFAVIAHGRIARIDTPEAVTAAMPEWSA